MNKALTLLFSCLLITNLVAQIDGENLFNENQVVTVEVDFSQTGFYDSLVANYATTTYMKADITITDMTGTYNYTDIGIRLKGNSSYSHPGNKKSFKIDFNEYVSGQNYDGLKKLNFSNGFKDPSCMREKVFFNVCHAAGVPAPRSNFANVYFNGELWGFYTIIEQIDDQFLDWAILDDDGNLFKAGDNFGGGAGGGGDAADLLDYGSDQSAYEAKYELKTNEDENDWTDLLEFIDFINNSSASDFENNLGDHIELQEYLRSAALDNLFSNLDSYTGSARNYYLYHNLSTDKWEWIKWDGNESFGSYGAGGSGGGLDMTTLALNYHDDDRPLLENVFNSTSLYDQYLTEVCTLSEQFFNPTYMNALIDNLKSLIQNSVYADNNKMYTNDDFDTNIENDLNGGGGPGGGTTYGLKSFIQEKSNYISGAVDCSQFTSISGLTVGVSSIFPNPAKATTRLQWVSTEVESVVLFNTLGQEVYRKSAVGKTALDLELSGLEAGIYIVVLLTENGQMSERLMVE